MSEIIENNSFVEFIEGLLSELEGIFSTSPSISARLMLGRIDDKLEVLKEYYSSHRLPRVSMKNKRNVVIAMNQGRDWAAEVKSCVLFADHVICEDPFLNSRRVYGAFSSDSLWQWGEDNLSRSALEQFRGTVGRIWDVMPLIRAGILTFFPINDPAYLENSAPTADQIEAELTRYLNENLIIVDDLGRHYYTVKIPLIDYEDVVEVGRDERWGDYSYREMIVRTCMKWLGPSTTSVRSGLYCADVISGTFWTTSDLNWKLCRDAARGLAPNTKIYSFIHEFTRPQLEVISSPDVLSVRNEEGVFRAFRADMVQTRSAIESEVDSPYFSIEIQQWFEDKYKPNFEMIEKAMRRNSLLRKLPWGMATVGFAYAGVDFSAAPVLASIFGTLSAALGFGFVPLFQDIVDKREAIRREPAYIFWKLERVANQL